MSIIYQAYLCSVRPFIERKENIKAIFNEFLIEVYLYLCYGLFDHSDTFDNYSIKEFVGWSMLGVLLFSILVNLADLVHKSFGMIAK